MKGQLLPDRRQRFTLEKVARVFVGAAGRLAIRALLRDALGTGQVGLLRAIELGGGEPERATRFSSVTSASRPRVMPSFGTSACRIASSRVLGAGNRPRPAAALQERRLSALRELVEPIAEHLREQLILHDLAIAADRSLIARRPQVAEAHDGVRCSPDR